MSLWVYGATLFDVCTCADIKSFVILSHAGATSVLHHLTRTLSERVLLDRSITTILPSPIIIIMAYLPHPLLSYQTSSYLSGPFQKRRALPLSLPITLLPLLRSEIQFQPHSTYSLSRKRSQLLHRPLLTSIIN